MIETEHLNLGFWEAKGILITGDSVIFARLPVPVLTADARSWALASCDILGEKPESATDLTDASERDFREQIEDLENWAQDPVANRNRLGNSPLHAPFWLRQRLMPDLPSVRHSDQVPAYVSALLANSIERYRPCLPLLMTDEELSTAREMSRRPALACAVDARLKEALVNAFGSPAGIEWLLFIEEPNNGSILYAVDRLRSAVRHTGNCLAGVLVSGEDDLYTHAARHIVTVAAGPHRRPDSVPYSKV